MKVAITSEGNSPDANVDSRFGRCAFFVIYDTDSQATEYIPNPNKDIIEGAGPSSVYLLASRGVQKVVSGEFGAKVKSIFDSLQIQLIVIKKTGEKIGHIIELLHHKI
jgi:predicted Fe-Mo cluster-binding NifX family protein